MSLPSTALNAHVSTACCRRKSQSWAGRSSSTPHTCSAWTCPPMASTRRPTSPERAAIGPSTTTRTAAQVRPACGRAKRYVLLSGFPTHFPPSSLALVTLLATAIAEITRTAAQMNGQGSCAMHVLVLEVQASHLRGNHVLLPGVPCEPCASSRGPSIPTGREP